MSFDPAKLLIVLVVALIVLGPEKLPGFMRQAGKYLNEIRAVRDRLKGEMDAAFGGVTDVATSLRTQVNQFSQLSPLRDTLGQVRDQVVGLGTLSNQVSGQVGTGAAAGSGSAFTPNEVSDNQNQSFWHSKDDSVPSQPTWWEVRGGEDFWEGNPVLN